MKMCHDTKGVKGWSMVGEWTEKWNEKVECMAMSKLGERTSGMRCLCLFIGIGSLHTVFYHHMRLAVGSQVLAQCKELTTTDTRDNE